MEQSSSWELERKLGRGTGKQRGEERRKRGKERDRILLSGRGRAPGSKFHPLAVHSNTLQGQKRKGERQKKKFLRLCTLFTQIYDRRLRHR